MENISSEAHYIVNDIEIDSFSLRKIHICKILLDFKFNF